MRITSGDVTGVTPAWSVNPLTLASLVPASCTLSPTQALCPVSITGNTIDSGTYSVSVQITDGFSLATCTPNPRNGTITVYNINPWWQVAWGSVITDGSVSSPIPVDAVSPYFITDPVGLLIYSSTTAPSFTPSGTVSSSGAVVNANVSTRPEASFDLFYNKKLPSDVKEAGHINIIDVNSLDATRLTSMGNLGAGTGNVWRGYKTYYYDGDVYGSNLTLNGNLNIFNGVRIVVFIENSSVTINGTIRSNTSGRSSFLLISEGNITVSPTVGGTPDGDPEIEGILYTDGTFSSGHVTTGYDQQLHVRGSVVANQFDLVRNLGTGPLGFTNNRYPGEYFEYGPEQVLAFPPFLRLRTSSWSEVAP